MDPLPFALKVPGREVFGLTGFSSTTFRFHGFLRLHDDGLLVEWSGTATVDEVGGTGVREETLALPAESVTVPLSCLRHFSLRGGWWRPCLEATANDLEALSMIPSEDQGRVRFWIARRNRRLAVDLVAAVSHARRHAPGGSREEP